MNAGSNESVPAASAGADGSRSEPATFGSGVDQNRGATGLAAGGSRSEPATFGTGADQERGATALAAGGSRSEPVTLGGAERGWESVKVEAEDVVACQGFLPTRCVGLDGDDRDAGIGSATRDTGVVSETQEWDAGVEGDDPDGDTGLGGDMYEDAGLAGGFFPVRRPPTAAGGGIFPTRGEEIVTNEPKLDQDVITAQNEESVEVVANSGVFSGLDTLRTNPKPGCGGEEEEGARSKSVDLNSKHESRNSESEEERDPGDSGNEDQPLDVRRADILSRTTWAETLTPALSRGERERDSERSASAETLTPALSRGERERGSKDPAKAFLRANPPPPPGAAPPPRRGRT